MNMRISVSSLVLALASAASAAPSVTILSCAQDAETREVRVEYRLTGEPAIVTLGLASADGTAVPDAKVVGACGDVCRRLGPNAVGESYVAYWTPGKELQGLDFSDGAKITLTAWPETNPPDWMLASLDVEHAVSYYADMAQVPGAIAGDSFKRAGLLMRHVRAKGRSFTMGADPSEAGDDSLGNETQHTVTFTNDFWMGAFPFTQGQYIVLTTKISPSYTATAKTDENVLKFPDYEFRSLEQYSYEFVRGSTGADWPTDGHTVAPGSLMDALRDRTGVDGFDLPTEAEWEYACRAGTTTPLNSGKEYSTVNALEVAWSVQNNPSGDAATMTLGLKPPNAWGLYDMHGNILEMCLDWYQADLGSDPVTAPKGPDTGDFRVLRGGGMCRSNGALRQRVRSASRLPNDKDSTAVTPLMVGFRPACEIAAGEDDDPVTVSADLASFAVLSPVLCAETTGHGTVENPFEAWDRDFDGAIIDRFSSFPLTGILLMVR